MPVSYMAKWKTAVQMLSLGFLIIGPYAPYTNILGLWLLALATIMTVITGVHYMIIAIHHLKDEQ